ncbi:MAG: NAD-dependent epimerase/dehydratase family protein [Bradymonadales bacterium]|nr:NAD-dependent epimerase/dehydratase family protein [Bradymonadales bacterium]
MKILVTGATGYIGGHLARRLASRSHQVVCLVRGQGKVDGLDLVSGDVTEPATLDRACAGVEVVCHCAGALGRWGVEEASLRAVNVDGVSNMVRAAHKAKVSYFLQVSAGGVTGPLGPRPADERTACHPYTPYERTKWQGEQQALLLARRLGLPLGVVRPTFTYGPKDRHKLSLFRAIQKGRFAFVGDRNTTLHPVFIDDLLDGMELMLERRPVQEIYIVGGAAPVTKRELVTTIAQALGVRPPWLSLPAGPAWLVAILLELAGRTVHVEPMLTRSKILMMSRNWGMDIGKARRDLGYNPKVDLAEGIARTVASYRAEGWL